MDQCDSPPAAQPVSPGTPQPFACNLCHQRKVKCDRLIPCANCKKSQITCEYREGRKSRPLKRKFSDELAHYQEVLKHQKYQAYAPYHADDRPSDAAERASYAPPTPVTVSAPKAVHGSRPDRDGEVGRFMKEDGKLRYIESSLWRTVAEEVPHHKHEGGCARPSRDPFPPGAPPLGVLGVPGGPDASALVLGTGVTGASSPKDLHPPPIQMYSLLNTYLENVNPVIKIVHTVSIQKEFQQAAENPEKLQKSTEALMFAIYLVAILSSTEDDCQTLYGEERSVLLSRYKSATEQALTSAQFLGTLDFTVLQAFVIYIISTQNMYDPRTVWNFTGIAVRIGQGQGLHRDGGGFKLPPFDAEMRRRLWWLIIILEAHQTQRAGASSPHTYDSSDTRVPLNVNDADLYPDMKESPTPRRGATEMIFFLMWCEILGSVRTFWLDKNRNPRSKNSREELLPHMEEVLEDRFLKYCDPLEPLHMLCSTMGRMSICKCRLLLHHPRQLSVSNGSEGAAQSKRDVSFYNSLKLVEYDNHMQSKPLQRFRWHTNNFLQYPAIIYLLIDLRMRPIDDLQFSRAWDQIEQFFENRSEFLVDNNKAICNAICSLCVKAWEAKEAKVEERARQQYKTPPFFSTNLRTPKFVTEIRRRRAVRHEAPGDPASTAGMSNGQGNPKHHGFVPINGNAPASPSKPVQNGGSDLEDPCLAWFDDLELFGDPSSGFTGAINWDLWDDLIHNGQ